MTQKRIQKILSERGICSRRQAEQFIQRGWVSVDGEVVTEYGTKADSESAEISLNEEAKEALSQTTMILFNKPTGVVTHSPQYDEQEIKDCLPEKYQDLAPIGRLDKESEGLILLSNDGVFAKECLQSETPHKRVYSISVSKPLTASMIQKCEAGVMLFGKHCKPCQVKVLSDTRYEVTLYEGKNRQIRRMIQKVGSHVLTLKRIQFGNLKLGDLKPNQVREIQKEDVF